MDNILIKLSGGALKDSKNDSIFDNQKLSKLSKQIATLSKKYGIGIVVGGGNIWRGNMDKNGFLSNEGANYIGMLATIMNGLALQDALKNDGVKTKLFSAVNVEKVTHPASVWEIKKTIEKNEIAIFVAGTGFPYFTTDTTSALRALDMSAKTILMAKDGVNGVYSDDPKINKSSIFYNELKYDDVLSKKLKVMDLTTITLCQQNNLEMLVFNIDEEDGIIKVLSNKTKFTKITN